MGAEEMAVCREMRQERQVLWETLAGCTPAGRGREEWPEDVQCLCSGHYCPQLGRGDPGFVTQSLWDLG